MNLSPLSFGVRLPDNCRTTMFFTGGTKLEFMTNNIKNKFPLIRLNKTKSSDAYLNNIYIYIYIYLYQTTEIEFYSQNKINIVQSIFLINT